MLRPVVAIILILLSGTVRAVALQVCHLDPGRGPQGEAGYEVFCNSDHVTNMFREAHIDEAKNTVKLWGQMINGFTTIFDSSSANVRNQKYFISSPNRGKAIELLRTNGFESRNNMEFTRRNTLEIVLTGEEVEVDNSERGYHTKRVDLPPTPEDQRKRDVRGQRDLDAARRARQTRIQNQ